MKLKHRGEGPYSFSLVYRNLGKKDAGPDAIIRVTHQVDREPEDRDHPDSYLALANIPHLSILAGSLGTSVQAWEIDGTSGELTAQERYIYESLRFFEEGGEPIGWAEGAWMPVGGQIVHETLWSARIALKLDEDPHQVYDTVLTVARDERTREGSEIYRRKSERHFDKLIGLLARAQEELQLSKDLRFYPMQLGGGLVGLELKYEGEPWFMWVTDTVYGASDRGLLGIYFPVTSVLPRDEIYEGGDNVMFINDSLDFDLTHDCDARDAYNLIWLVDKVRQSSQRLGALPHIMADYTPY